MNKLRISKKRRIAGIKQRAKENLENACVFIDGISAKGIDAAIDCVIDHFEDLCYGGRFEEIDRILQVAKSKELDPAVAYSLTFMSYCVRSKLPHWDKYLVHCTEKHPEVFDGD